MTDELVPPLPPTSARRWPVWLLGMAAASAVAGLLSIGINLMANSEAVARSPVPFIIPSLFLLPLLIGLTAAFVWRKLQPTLAETTLQCLYLTLLDVAGAAVFLREGTICLIIGFPLLYGLMLSGGLLGRVLFKRNPSRLHVSVLPLLALLALAEPLARTERTGVVTDEILIHAPPARVWPQITAFPAIPAPPRFWLFHLGLPYPVATTTAGDYPGADRRCIFSRNAVFKGNRGPGHSGARTDLRYPRSAARSRTARPPDPAPEPIFAARQRRRNHDADRQFLVHPARPAPVVFRLVDARHLPGQSTCG